MVSTLSGLSPGSARGIARSATLDPAQDALVWEPNLTAAANEDHKGYHALLSAFVRKVRGEPSDAPGIADGVRAMRVLEAMVRSMESGRTEQP
ncbi:MAG: hypothetical protein JSR21_21015 [Proteobacteria bacterium]|nr:hypothetical protein [Pseudomonadota bacterium]